MFGDIGGTISVFTAISAFLVARYAELSFQLMAIMALFRVKHYEKFKKIGAGKKVRIIFNCCPDPDYKKLLARGVKLLENETDIV